MAAGIQPAEAAGAVVMVHGRGASPESILALAPTFGREDYAYLAPRAAGGTWYPHSFLAPIASNEPGISSGMQAIEDAISLLEGEGLPRERIVLLGFSQGACLTLEYAARHAMRYGGVVGLSGGLIGPESTPRDYSGTLQDTPTFLGCSDIDPHIPLARVELSAEVLTQLGADVTLRVYPGMGHLVNEDEISHVRRILALVADG